MQTQYAKKFRKTQTKYQRKKGSKSSTNNDALDKDVNEQHESSIISLPLASCYQAEVTEIQELKRRLHLFGLPTKWHMHEAEPQTINQSIIMTTLCRSSLAEQEAVLMIKVTQSLDLHAQLDGYQIKLNEITTGLPTSVKSVNDIYNVLKMLEQYNVCAGNDASQYKNVLSGEVLAMRMGMSLYDYTYFI